MRCSATRSVSPMRPDALRVDVSVTRPRLSPSRKRSAESVAICSCAAASRLAHHVAGALRRLLGALAHDRRDVGDPRLGGAERLRQSVVRRFEPSLDRLGLLREAGGDRLERLAPLRQAGLHQLVRLATAAR